MNEDYNKSAETRIEVVELAETDNTVCFSGRKKRAPMPDEAPRSFM
jgi:hypothetical protein